MVHRHRETQSPLTKRCNHLSTNVEKNLEDIWTDRITNEDLWKQASKEAIQIQIRRHKWRWIGRTLRNYPDSLTRQALQ